MKFNNFVVNLPHMHLPCRWNQSCRRHWLCRTALPWCRHYC